MCLLGCSSIPEGSLFQKNDKNMDVQRWVKSNFKNIVFIDEVEGIKRRITDEAGGRVCNPTLDPDTEAINDI